MPQVVGKPGDVVGLLDRHRHAEQRTPLAPRERRVRVPRGVAGAVEVAHHDGVDFRVVRLDPLDGVVKKLDGRDLSGRKRRRLVPCGPVRRVLIGRRGLRRARRRARARGERSGHRGAGHKVATIEFG